MSARTLLHEVATAVMADFDEETTGNSNLDNLINAAMAHKCDVNADLLAALVAVSPWVSDNCWCEDEDRGHGREGHSPVCEQARAAIAKAGVL